MSGETACCACLKVVYKPEEFPDGKLRERWVCESCGNEFHRMPRNMLPYVRKEVADFAYEMECVLRENDYKGGWKGSSMEYLIQRLTQETRELIDATLIYKLSSDAIIKEAVDVANFAMMIADNTR